jgi:8-oxo-dGTP diphosphatase
MTDMIGEADGKKFMIAVDAVITVQGKVVLIRRVKEPFAGEWVLPGGRVDINETLEEAVKREVLEETGITIQVKKLVGVYDALDRDPRGRVVSVCYLCDGDALADSETSEAAEIRLFNPGEVPALGFDHNQMLRDALAT